MPSDGAILGLARTDVVLVVYHQDWIRQFERERDTLQIMLGNSLLEIEHVGSTAIPGMCAKPILDLMVAVSDLDIADQFHGMLKAIGYERRVGADALDRRFFVKGPPNCRTHHLNFTFPESDFWLRTLLFRDYLIKNRSAAAEYAKIKIQLATEFSHDRPSYTERKAQFVAGILAAARAEA